jgi:hypothetical protein
MTIWHCIVVIFLVCLFCCGMLRADRLCSGNTVLHSRLGLSREGYCCINTKCSAGHTPVCDATTQPNVGCKPCPAGTFQDKETWSLEMAKCNPHSVCTGALTEYKSGSSVSDTTCMCNQALRYKPLDASKPYGQASSLKCTKMNDDTVTVGLSAYNDTTDDSPVVGLWPRWQIILTAVSVTVCILLGLAIIIRGLYLCCGKTWHREAAKTNELEQGTSMLSISYIEAGSN